MALEARKLYAFLFFFFHRGVFFLFPCLCALVGHHRSRFPPLFRSPLFLFACFPSNSHIHTLAVSSAAAHRTSIQRAGLSFRFVLRKFFSFFLFQSRLFFRRLFLLPSTPSFSSASKSSSFSNNKSKNKTGGGSASPAAAGSDIVLDSFREQQKQIREVMEGMKVSFFVLVEYC